MYQRSIRALVWTVLLGTALLATACTMPTPSTTAANTAPTGTAAPADIMAEPTEAAQGEAPADAGSDMQIANPASQNCIDQGGDLTIETNGSGGQYGVCVFEDNLQCEEWAMMRGDCPVGGIKVTGYDTDAARYCAITGGTYTVDEEAAGNDHKEQGTCALPDGTTCDVYEYFDGMCGVGSDAADDADSATATDETSTDETAAADANDPFAYCADVGVDDAPPYEKVDGQLPAAIVQGMIDQQIISADAPDSIQQSATWRCMDGKIYACTYGANLPCDEKADDSETPSDAMTSYCQDNADSDVIPAAVTGRTTVYSWKCGGATPTIIEQVATADAQGYLSNFWYELTPPQ